MSVFFSGYIPNYSRRYCLQVWVLHILGIFSCGREAGPYGKRRIVVLRERTAVPRGGRSVIICNNSSEVPFSGT